MRALRSGALLFALVITVPIATPSVSAQAISSLLGQNAPKAKATLYSCTDQSLVGSATLFEVPSSEGVKNVAVVLSVRDLTPGKHAVHIHEAAACTPCSAAGSHLDLGPHGHNVPVTANHPYHSGDLINVRVDSSGKGFMTHVTSRVALSAGNLSIFEDNGAPSSSLIIHDLDDEYCPDPNDGNCAGGGRVACGIIERIR